MRQISFTDFEEFAALVPGSSVVATPLAPAPFSAEVTHLRLDEVHLRIGRITPMMFTGDQATTSARVVLPLGRPGTLRLNGRAVRPGNVAVYGPGASYDGACPDGTSWASLIVPAAMLDALLKSPRRSPLRRPDSHAVLCVGQEAWAEAESLVMAASQVATEDPRVFQVAEARRSLKADLLETVRGLLAAANRTGARRALSAAPERQRILRAVEDNLRAVPARARCAKDVCAALGLSSLRLRVAIEASFGVDPERYLRMRRLALARAALRSTDRCWTSVEQVATAHGFPDPAAFGREYLQGFGHAPILASVHGTG